MKFGLRSRFYTRVARGEASTTQENTILTPDTIPQTGSIKPLNASTIEEQSPRMPFSEIEWGVLNIVPVETEVLSLLKIVYRERSDFGILSSALLYIPASDGSSERA